MTLWSAFLDHTGRAGPDPMPWRVDQHDWRSLVWMGPSVIAFPWCSQFTG